MDRTADDAPLATLAAEVARLADRLRAMSDVRLGQPFPPAGTRAAAALDLAQHLADAAHGVTERAAAGPPTPRVVPDVGVFALGDQVAVTGADLAAAAAGLPADTPVWSAGVQRPLAGVLAGLAEVVRGLRLAL